MRWIVGAFSDRAGGLMSDESRTLAAWLAAGIFNRTMFAWNAVHTFRWMGELGLPLATKLASQEHKRTSQYFADAEEYARMFLDMEGNVADRQELVNLGFFDKMETTLTEQSVTTFQSALDAASVIFAHSVLDSAALDWCKVCAVARPEDFIKYVGKTNVTLSEVQKAGSFSKILRTAIDEYLQTLERASLIKKLDILFELCQPPSDFIGIKRYKYNRDRIIALDKLRHDFAHRGLGGRLPQGDDDLQFLFDTMNFLFPLVNHRYGIQLDVNMAAALMKAPSSQTDPAQSG
jgi:hypothetical protein